MDVHLIFISGMDEEDTNKYFMNEGWNNITVYKNQINKQTKLICRDKNPIRVTIWCMMNTPITNDLIHTINDHMKYVVFLYHANKPITLLRCVGFHEKLKKYNILGIVLATHMTKKLNTEEYNMNTKIIENMVDLDDKELPHYNMKLTSILKLFINI